MHDEKKNERIKWIFDEGLSDYLDEFSGCNEKLLDETIILSKTSDDQALDVAVNWTEEASNIYSKNLCKLIPTALGGSHFKRV